MKTGRRLVLFPFPLVGHQNPMFELGNVLHSRGFSISVIHTRLHSPSPANYPHFSFHFIDDGVLVTDSSFDAIIALMNLLNKKLPDSLGECLSRILACNASDQEPLACIITDAHWHCSQAVADHLNVPRIVLRTGNMSSFIELFARHRRDPEGDQSPVDELLSNVVRTTKACRGLIFNSFEEIEESAMATVQQDFRVPIFPIGPFHKWLPSSQEGGLSWLDTQAPNSVLYVSFGSLAAIDQAGFLEMAWGLASRNQPFLWVVRSDLVHTSDGLPDEFLQEVAGRGHIVGWAPQKEVLAHAAVGGFWTHCGWNSTLEGISEGMPMICTPSFGDQMLDARYVTDVWEIGLRLDKGATREDVGKAICKLMAENEGEEMRKRAADLKNKATICLLPGGSSFKHMEDLVNLIMSF